MKTISTHSVIDIILSLQHKCTHIIFNSSRFKIVEIKSFDASQHFFSSKRDTSSLLNKLGSYEDARRTEKERMKILSVEFDKRN